jgi:exodeoxyribonuclease VII large subunit
MVCFNDERVVRAIADCPIPVVAGIGHQRDESLADLVADICAHTPTAAAEQAVPLLSDLVAEHRYRVARLSQVLTDSLEAAADQLYRQKARLRRLHLDRQIRQESQTIAWKRQQLLQSTTHRLQSATQHCHLLRQKLATLDPTAVLSRGYAILRQENGSVVRSAAALAVGQDLTLQLAEGEVQVRVLETRRSHDGTRLGSEPDSGNGSGQAEQSSIHLINR